MSLLLTLLLAQLSWSVLLAARRTTARLTARAEALDTERLGWHVLSAEVRAGVAGRDWSVALSRVLPLRAFRGLGELCPGTSDAEGGLVRYHGIRLADPAKDSLLLLTGAGEWRTVKLVARATTSLRCPGWEAGALERWRWDPPVAGVLLARVFERGSYHLEDGALRYRLGEAGRQPLTLERLEAASTFARVGAALELRLRVIVEQGVTWETTRRTSGLDPSGG